MLISELPIPAEAIQCCAVFGSGLTGALLFLSTLLTRMCVTEPTAMDAAAIINR